MEPRYTVYVRYTRRTLEMSVECCSWLRTGTAPAADQKQGGRFTFAQMEAMIKLIDLPYDQELVSFTAYPVKN